MTQGKSIAEIEFLITRVIGTNGQNFFFLSHIGFGLKKSELSVTGIFHTMIRMNWKLLVWHVFMHDTSRNFHYARIYRTAPASLVSLA